MSNFFILRKRILKFAYEYFCAVSIIVLKLKFLDNTILHEYGYTAYKERVNLIQLRQRLLFLDIELYSNKDIHDV